MSINQIYSDRILELAGNLPQMHPLEAPDATARRVSRVCGSSIDVELKIESNRVVDYAHDVNACALGQTSASIVAQQIIGSTLDELRTVRTQMVAMLKANGAAPSGKWEDLKYLEPVRDYKPRHASTLLVFDAVVDAIDSYEVAQKERAS
ncbi:iron-sulfur cluster assembly scaffold protein [uncultured Maritalea sp.]|uniref:iron-sulfur cluster assembly scaffold protein n=1 Tax=uncultured Maritalea sp. TaxID=757249 RepID=UPI00260F24F2|nr:iron-sulfur cluster assembly scaffold protein [uncultured Maritalea sp.]